LVGLDGWAPPRPLEELVFHNDWECRE
jgi:hypothetical protein